MTEHFHVIFTFQSSEAAHNWRNLVFKRGNFDHLYKGKIYICNKEDIND